MAKIKPSQQIDYQALKADLDSIMAKMQQEDLDVDVALQNYRRGLELVRQLQEYLKTAENTVTELKSQLKAQK